MLQNELPCCLQDEILIFTAIQRERMYGCEFSENKLFSSSKQAILQQQRGKLEYGCEFSENKHV